MRPGESAKAYPTQKPPILGGTKDYESGDLGKKLVFPGVVQTTLRPDIVVWSPGANNCVKNTFGIKMQ